MQFPKSLRENKQARLELLQKAEDDKAFRGILKEKCSRDILFWFKAFAWTYDPRLPTDKYVPFIPYDFQDDFIVQVKEKIDKAKQGQTLGVEKCRDMGVSWMILAVFYWYWLFGESEDFLIGSRKEEYVDKKKLPDTLFGKLDILLKRTPHWMLPKGFNNREHNTHMVMKNPETGGTIRGESANTDFSRSGRYKAVLMDELAFWQNASPAYSAASESCNLIIPVSTPNPEGSGFFEYLVNNKDKYDFIRLEHHLHPKKDSEWLREQYKHKSPEVIAVEILMDYQGAIRGKVYQRAMQCEVSEEWDYDPNLPLYRAWDFGHGGEDDTVILWFQKDFKTNAVRLIDFYEKNEEDINFFAPIAKGASYQLSEFVYDDDDHDGMERRRLWRAAQDFGDPYDANTRTFVKQTTIAKELAQHGINMQVKTDSKVSDRIEKGRMLMKRLKVHSRCLPVLERLAKAKYPSRSESSQATSKPNLPVHDDTSHVRTAYEYFADNEPEETKRVQNKVVSKYTKRTPRITSKAKFQL